MQFTMTVSEKTLSTIITALKLEKVRAIEEGNEKNLAFIESAIDEISDNTYISNVNEVE